jgi:hypothetical protein
VAGKANSGAGDAKQAQYTYQCQDQQRSMAGQAISEPAGRHTVRSTALCLKGMNTPARCEQPRTYREATYQSWTPNKFHDTVRRQTTVGVAMPTVKDI